jgi:hypothetical protein
MADPRRLGPTHRQSISSRRSARVPGVPGAGARERHQQCALDVVVVPELELGSVAIEELKPRWLVDGAAQADDGLKRQRQGGKFRDTVGERSPIESIAWRKFAALPQANLDARAIGEIDAVMHPRVINEIEGRTRDRYYFCGSAIDVDERDRGEIVEAHDLTIIGARRPRKGLWRIGPQH